MSTNLNRSVGRGMKLLFVCTGNTCRSSMAEVMARQIAAEAALIGYAFVSAGTWAAPGSPASEHARRVVAEYGLDLESHRARLLTREVIEEADLILTMTAAHKEQVLQLFPAAEGKVFTLLRFGWGQAGDVADPFGGDIDAYRQAAAQIRHVLTGVISRLSENNKG